MSALQMIEAEVQVGAESTRYLRCGRGARAVIVLAENAAERERLVRRFADTGTVIAPLPEWWPPTHGDDLDAVEQWLNGLIDGLGLDRPTIALAPGLVWLAERLVTHSAERLDIVAVAAG